MDINDNRTPTVFRRGADKGWRLGLYMFAIFCAAAYSVQIPLLGVVSFVLMVLVPFVVYRWLSRDYVRYPSQRFFSAVWMQGICCFFFGALIYAVLSYAFLRFVEPDWIVRNVHLAADFYRSINDPEAQQMATALQGMIDKHLLPSAINIAISMIWTITFTGSMLSLLLTVLVRQLNKKRINGQQN